MDTREKIVSVEEISGEGWLAVAGLFDPLTLEQAERVATIAGRQPERRLLAVVEPGNGTLLSAEARAALVAGLREVSAVVIAEPDAIRAHGIEVEEDLPGEKQRSEQFVQFVLARQRAR
ncbi:MAG TPA: hypothetical protein VKX25_10955 [Bryobacteraceae bacterium]|jgi:hypothetical protein|nr:hypothetical protein [Bryobacteraceae bacterium]